MRHLASCEVTPDMDKGTTYLSQTHDAEEILRTYNFWNATPRLTPMQPNTRLNADNFDRNPALDFHRRYRGIFGRLKIAKALARNSIEIGLPKHYAPNHVVPEGKMRVVGAFGACMVLSMSDVHCRKKRERKNG